MNLTQLVVGLGEVGAALQMIFKCDGHDPFKNIVADGHYDVVHIAIPYRDETSFIEAIRGIREAFTPSIVINHSSVPVGTSRKCDMVHSPIRGVHPFLEKGIRTIVKFIGAVNVEDAKIVARLYEQAGIEYFIANKPEDTEAAKLWCTTGYGLNIVLEKSIHDYCVENDLDFDVVYTEFIKTYNDGYAKLGLPQFCKYNLKHFPGSIGGHCILPNIELLNHPIGEYIKKFNDERIKMFGVQDSISQG